MTKDMRDILRARHAEQQRMREDADLARTPVWLLRHRYPVTMGATSQVAKDMTGPIGTDRS